MAMPTTSHPANTPQQAHTPGVGATPGTVGSMRPSMHGVQQTADTQPAEPVLFEDIDRVLLMRLYPDSKSGEEMDGLAKAAGAKAHEDGLHLKAAAQDETPLDAPPAPPPARPPA